MICTKRSAVRSADHMRSDPHSIVLIMCAGALLSSEKKTSSSPKNQLTVFKLSGYHSTSNKQRKFIPIK